MALPQCQGVPLLEVVPVHSRGIAASGCSDRRLDDHDDEWKVEFSQNGKNDAEMTKMEGLEPSVPNGVLLGGVSPAHLFGNVRSSPQG